MDDGCSPTVGILIFAGFVILDFVVFGRLLRWRLWMSQVITVSV